MTQKSKQLPNALPTGIYKHYKGGLYLVLGQARHSETGEILVVYVPLYDTAHEGVQMAVRPAEMFDEHTQYMGCKVKRFTWIGPTGAGGPKE